MDFNELGEALRPWQYQAMEEYQKARIEALEAYIEDLEDTIKTSQYVVKHVYAFIMQDAVPHQQMTNIQLLLDKYDTIINNE